MTARIQASSSPVWVRLEAAAGLRCKDTSLPGAASFHGVPHLRQRSEPGPGPQCMARNVTRALHPPSPDTPSRPPVPGSAQGPVPPSPYPAGSFSCKAQLEAHHFSEPFSPPRESWPPCSSQGTALPRAPSGLAVSSYITSHHLL